MPTFSPNKGFVEPTVDGDLNTWGTELNQTIGILDNNLGGLGSLSVAGNSNVTASATQAQNLVQRLTGALTGNIEYILPAVGSLYVIDNETSGAFTVTVLTTATGSVGVVVPQGTALAVYSDGTNVYPCTGTHSGSQNIPSLTVTGSTTMGPVTCTTLTGTTGTFSGPLISSTLATGTVSASGTVSGLAGFIASGYDAGGLQYRIVNGNYGAGWRNDGSNLYLLLTSSGNQDGTWNAFRPLIVNLTTAAVTIDDTGSGVIFGGQIGWAEDANFYITPNNGHLINFDAGQYIQFNSGIGFSYVTTGTHFFAGNVEAINSLQVNQTFTCLGSGNVSGNLNAGGLSVGGVGVVVNNGATYAINISGVSAGCPWGGISGIPALCYNNGGTYGINITGNAGTAQGALSTFTVPDYIVVNGGSNVPASGYYIDNAGSGFSPGQTVPAGLILNNGLWVQTAGVVCYSDGRLKSDIVDLTPEEGLLWIKRGRPRRYNYGGKLCAGFVAQEEVESGRNECLSIVESNDPRVADGEGKISDGFAFVRDYNHDVAYLTAALKAALARIEALEARLA